MDVPEAELVLRLQRRARSALVAGVSALNDSAGARRKKLAKLSVELIHEALVVTVLRFVVLAMASSRGLLRQEQDFSTGRLFQCRTPLLDVRPRVVEGAISWGFPELLQDARRACDAAFAADPGQDAIVWAECQAELVGNLYELLIAEGLTRDETGQLRLASGARRKKTGAFFTPRALTRVVVARALEAFPERALSGSESAPGSSTFRVCDPAVGGGAFLLEVARALSARSSAADSVVVRRTIAAHVLYGVDIDPTAVAVAEAALWLFVDDPSFSLGDAGRHLRVADALLGPPYGPLAPIRAGSRPELHSASPKGFDFVRDFAEVFEAGGFDLVIGNPPWVAYAGRAAQPLAPARKAYLGAHYASFKGYPTLHALFIERALSLAPRGIVALVVPSPIADLQGYRAVRRAVRVTHTLHEPMLEFGQDAFDSVTQPCFALIARAPRAAAGVANAAGADDAPFRLAERQHAGVAAREVVPPRALLSVAKGAVFPRELFGEMGFQTTKAVTQNLLRRAAEPDAQHCYPLLEGRDVRAFSQGPPRLFLRADAEALAKARCRLRAVDDYQRVRFVVRQTARYPIAALHSGLPFRNSLLAGFETEHLPPELVVGLLNSSLYRSLHLSLQRDARQATFPQVKIGHLRALPEPPANGERRDRVVAISRELSRGGLADVRSEPLDEAVFSLFGMEHAAALEVLQFFAARTARRERPA